MVDFAVDVYKKLYGTEPPAYLVKKREEVVAKLHEHQSITNDALEIIVKPEVTKEIEQSRDSKQLLEVLQTKHGVC